MSDTKFALREEMAGTFELALRNAGMARGLTGSNVAPDKPKYWRGRVPKSNTLDDMFLLYTITDNLELNAADNKSFRRQLFANGQLYTRTGFSSGDFQDLAEAIEKECEKLGIILTFEGEGVDTSIDQDSPVSYCNFEAEMKLLV